ncbi:MAG: cob(I)yrinic acid a,c-diamide adenosyltransferase [Actinomycetota bacterium]
MPRIYTGTGDDGSTGLLFGGRVSKADLATEAYGTTDEAVAALGVARALLGAGPLAERILELQRELFVVGADLAANPAERAKLQPEVSLVTPAMVERLERLIDAEVERSPLPQEFIVPGADPASAALDVARAILRRAERASVRLREAGGAVHDDLVRYLNRLSDLLFVLARSAAGGPEPRSRDR